jgi:hypothetical protein
MYPHQKQQQGSVLFMALVFLVLTALIAVTTMDTGILSRKMAGNSQFKEDAMQITEGVVNEVALSVIELMDSVKAPVIGDTMCMVGSTEANCTPSQKVLTLSQEMTKAAGGTGLYYRALFNKEESQSGGSGTRMGEGEISEGLLLRYVEVEGSYNGVDKGLSQASLAVGIMNKALSPNSGGKKDVKADAGGSGGGSWGMVY